MGSKMFCPFCGLKNQEGVARCITCGGEMPAPDHSKASWFSYRPGPGLGCMIGLAAVGFMALVITVPQYVLYQRHVAMSREAMVRNNMRMMWGVMEQYGAENGQYPAVLDFQGAYAGDQGLHNIQFMARRLKNPFDPAQPSVVVSPSDPPYWNMIKPGQVVFVPRGVAYGWAKNFLIYGKGKKDPLPDTMSGGYGQ